MLKWRPDVRLAKGMFNKLKEPRLLFDNPQESEGIILRPSISGEGTRCTSEPGRGGEDGGEVREGGAQEEAE